MALQSEGALSAGLNPFPGLFKYTSVTLVLFVVFLIIIFSSVKNSIFERKKDGFGLEVKDKEEKGYSRWAKEREYKEDKGVEVVNPLDQETKVAGIPLINDGKHIWVDNGEYHNLVIGSTGSGKSQTVVEPMVELLIKKGESMIITDPKAELYIAAGDYLKERGYKVVILNFRDPQKGNAWNPLTLPYQYYNEGNRDKAAELLDDVALNILYDPNNKGEPFWEKSAADYFSGLALGLFEDAKEEEMNINSINFMSTIGEEKLGGSNTYIKEYFTLKGESSNAYVFASNTINAPQDTKGSILSVFRQKIRGFSSRENLSEMLSYSDFDIREIGKEKTAVFIVIHDEKTTYHSLATIFIKQVYETLIDVAQANGGKLPYRTNFILDEFANMPPLKDVGTMVTAARSRDIRFTFIIQNFAQLKGVYGAEIAETIKGNCGNLVYLISTELAALEEISKMCGDEKSKDSEKTTSTPLVSVTDLQKLKLFQAIIIRWRLSPLKVKYTPNFKMDWGHKKSNSSFPIREVKDIKLFDVKNFVKEKKREKTLQSLDGNPDGGMKSPFGGSGPFGGSPSPFGGGSSPFGGGSSPFGGSPSPFGGGSSPFGGPPSPFSSSSPFAPNNNSNTSPFSFNDNSPGMGGFSDNKFDFEKMMADIDKKIAELDAEEARQKEELAKKNQGEKAPDTVPNDKKDLSVDISVEAPNTKVESKELDEFDPIKAEIDRDLNDKLASIKEANIEEEKSTNLPKLDTSTTNINLNIATPEPKPIVTEDKSITIPTLDTPTTNINLNISTPEVNTLDNEEREILEKPKVNIENTSPNINLNITTSDVKPLAVETLEINDQPKINIDTPTPNIAVATKSPVEEEEFINDNLPKAEEADLINPIYLDSNIRVDNSLEANSSDSINIDSGISSNVDSKNTLNTKDSIENNQEVIDLKQRIQNNLARIEKENQNNQTTHEENTNKVEGTKANVNIDADSVVVNNNNPITDDEFFDDFFGDE